ncbi:alanine/glycine:cation symporter family protein [Glycocaulis sp.]|uniref:alanine/glycine:cation symporter family protein n=1 Tax=Glycocaulis sp. TaxID=1969725 RepID=UPI003D1DBAC9
MAVEQAPAGGTNLVDLVFMAADFLWGGYWGDDQIVPMGPMVVALLGIGLFLMVRLGFRPVRTLGGAFSRLWGGRKGDESAGDITPWQALSTALSGQVGTGNLAGVATAISLGGPGAIFWMWITALFGMALSYAEGSLAVRFREKHADGHFHGGPMYYIKNGLGKGWGWLAVVFCIGALFSALATGNMIQSNSITNGVQTGTENNIARILPCQLLQPTANIGMSACEARRIVDAGGIIELDASGRARGARAAAAADAAEAAAAAAAAETGQVIDPEAAMAAEAAPGVLTADTLRLVVAAWIPGALIAFFVFLVIIGGIKSIGRVAGIMVPFMAAAYVLVAAFVLVLHIEHVPGAFMQIFEYAFGFGPAVGGLAGYAVMEAVRFGVARGLFSNEAGQGSLPIAHAAAQTKNPIRQGEMAMLGTFIDTIIICTMTALVILVVAGQYPTEGGGFVEYAWMSIGELQDVGITSAAFGQGLPVVGGWVIGLALALFAFTTLIGWSYYAEQSATYLVGDWAAKPFRFVWVAMVFTGAIQANDFVWRLGDIANSAMALPNLLALLLLSGMVVKYTRDFDKNGVVPPAWFGDTAKGPDGKPVASAKPESGKGEEPAG